MNGGTAWGVRYTYPKRYIESPPVAIRETASLHGTDPGFIPMSVRFLNADISLDLLAQGFVSQILQEALELGSALPLV